MKEIPRICSSSVQNGSVKLTQLSPEEHQVVLRLLAPSDALAVYPPLRRIWRRRTGSAWVRYYDSVGKHVRDYLDRPSTLPTMGSVEFVVQRSDTTGGPGANFLIRWHAAVAVDEPLVEAIMLGQSGDAGISFSSRGRTFDTGARTLTEHQSLAILIRCGRRHRRGDCARTHEHQVSFGAPKSGLTNPFARNPVGSMIMTSVGSSHQSASPGYPRVTATLKATLIASAINVIMPAGRSRGPRIPPARNSQPP